MSKQEIKYYVYVIGLNPGVLNEPKFKKWNPQYKEGKSCYYIGSSYLPPSERYRIHTERIPMKRGSNQYNKWVYHYHDGLRPSQYKNLPAYESRKEAMEAEKQKAWSLRKRGHAVWTDKAFMEEFIEKESNE